MRLEHVVTDVVNQLAGRLLRRAAGYALIGLFALGALYQFTVAGTLQLESEFGLLTARLIVAAAYAAAALVTLAVLMATRGKVPARDEAGLMGSPRNMRIAMLMESVLLGYALARNKSRDR